MAYIVQRTGGPWYRPTYRAMRWDGPVDAVPWPVTLQALAWGRARGFGAPRRQKRLPRLGNTRIVEWR